MFTRFLSFKGGDEMKKKEFVDLERDAEGKLIRYIRFERLKEKAYRKWLDHLSEDEIIFQHLYKNQDVHSFCELVYQFEKENNSSENAIYALSFDLLLPYSVNTLEMKKKLIKAFIRQYRGDLAIHINYFVVEYCQGKGTYLKIIVFEREYLNKKVMQRYKQDVCTYPIINGKRTKKLIHPCGSVKKDKQGKKIKKHVLFGNKLRLFNFPNEHMLKIALTQMIENALHTAFTVKYETKLRFKRKTVYSTANRFKRIVAQRINQLKTYIESKLNYYYKRYKRISEGYDDLEYENSIERMQLLKINTIYYKIAGIFEANEYIEDQNLYPINYRYVRLPDLSRSIEKIIAFFHRNLEHFGFKF